MSKAVVKITGNLLPSASNAEDIIGLLSDMVAKHGVNIKTMLDSDSLAFEKADLRYFDERWFGKIPTYPQFMRALKKSNPDLVEELRYAEAETLGGEYEQSMRNIADTRTEDFDGSESKRFGWNEKLYKIQERKIDRIDRRRKDDNIERGVDMAVRVISALKDSELLKVKKVIKDVEWEEVGGDGARRD